MSVDISNPQDWDITPENLLLYGMDPIIAGDYLQHRYQARRAGAAVSLDGATLVMTVRRKDSTSVSDVLFNRRSIDNIDGWSPTLAELTLDSQVTENTVLETGTGWWSMNFTPADESLLLAYLGLWWYDVRAKWSNGQIRTLLRGRIQILPPRTTGAGFTP